MTDKEKRFRRNSKTNELESLGGLGKLRRDVLKQTLAAIARFVSAVNYADYFHYVNSINSKRSSSAPNNSDGSAVLVSASIGGGGNHNKYDDISVASVSQITMRTVENPMFNVDGLSEALGNAMDVMSEFGVEIMGVSIISAHPVDQTLRDSLSTSAVASAEALKVEARARGLARAVEIEAEAASMTTSITAEAEAKAVLTKAKADAQAEILRSDGAKEAQILRAEGEKAASKLANNTFDAADNRNSNGRSLNSSQKLNHFSMN